MVFLFFCLCIQPKQCGDLDFYILLFQGMEDPSSVILTIEINTKKKDSNLRKQSKKVFKKIIFILTTLDVKVELINYFISIYLYYF